MSYIDKESGQIILSDDDRNALNNKEKVSDNIMNWVIWGNAKHFYSNNKLTDID